MRAHSRNKLRSATMMALCCGAAATVPPATFNVRDYGAKGDGKANDTAAIQRAIDMCHTVQACVVSFPPGDYISWPLISDSPNTTIDLTAVDVKITVGASPSTWPNHTAYPSFLQARQFTAVMPKSRPPDTVRRLLAFESTLIVPSASASQGNFRLTGQGTMDGQGAPWWDIRKVHHISIQAPPDSPNTDGVNFGGQGCHIHDIHVDNGDDGACTPPPAPASAPALQPLSPDPQPRSKKTSRLQNLTFDSSENVARIKTWQLTQNCGIPCTFWGGAGLISNISYIDIRVTDTDNTVLITQFYCPHSQHPLPCPVQKQNVEIRDILFENITGTTKTTVVGTVQCSESNPCRDIDLHNVDLTPSGPSGNDAHWECSNAHGAFKDVHPPASCLSPQ
eukprot:gene9412-1692_t